MSTALEQLRKVVALQQERNAYLFEGPSVPDWYGKVMRATYRLAEAHGQWVELDRKECGLSTSDEAIASERAKMYGRPDLMPLRAK